MITKVVLGDGTVLENVEEVQEVVQNNGNYILNGLTINIIKDENGVVPNVSEIEAIFSKAGRLNNIKVYKKDVIETKIDEETGKEIKIYGDEYLAFETSKYTGVQSIYKHIESDRISIQLTSDPTSIADEKYNELVAENERLEQTILELTMLLGGVM